MFIKRIGLVWFQGENNINKSEFVQNIHNWRILNPEWEVVIFDDNMLRQICKNYSEDCLKVYDSFDIMHLKIDFGRYVALWETCGMYVDMDCYAFRSLDKSQLFNDFINKTNTYDHIIGLSEGDFNFFEKIVTNLQINNAIMISSVKNPVIKDLIDNIISINRNYKSRNNIVDSSYITVNSITGPKMINQFFKEIKLSDYKQRIYIHKFPFYVFEPGQPFRNFDIKDDTIAIHKYELSWLSPKMKRLTKSYYDIIKPYILIFIIFVLIIWLVYKYYYTNCKKRCDSICKLK